MADNVLETVQKLVQDVIAPDVRELKARLDGFEHRTDDHFKALEQRIDDRFKATDQRMDDRFKAMDDRFKAMEQHMDDRFKVIDERFKSIDERFTAADQKLEHLIGKVLSAIAGMKTETELTAVREVSALRERVAVLEMQQKQATKAA